MHNAFSSQCLEEKLSFSISCIHSHGSRLFVGSTSGQLLVLDISVTPIAVMHILKTFSTSSIDQLQLIHEMGILLCLSNGMVYIYDATTYNILNSLASSKGANIFSVHRSTEMINEVPNLITRLCIGTKRKLIFYEWCDSQFLDVKELTTPEKVLSMAWFSGNVLCLGFSRNFILVDLKTSSVSEVTSFQSLIGGRSLMNDSSSLVNSLSKTISLANKKPFVTRVNSELILLTKESISVMVGSDGILKSVSDKLPNIFNWSEPLINIEFSFPFMIGLTSGHIEIRSCVSTSIVQIIPIKKSKFSYSDPKFGIFIASNHSLWELKQLPFSEQIHALIASKEYQDARTYLDITTNVLEQEKNSLLLHLDTIWGYDLFNNGKYTEAMELFRNINLSPIHVLALFPNLISSDLKKDISYPFPVILHDDNVIEAMRCLAVYLIDQRTKLTAETLKKSSFIFPLQLFVQKQAGTKSVIESQKMLEIIDTCLLKVYLYTNEALVGPLVRLPNYCNIQESEDLLIKMGKHKDLNDFYFGKGLHIKALDYLKKLYEVGIEGSDMMCMYLERLDSNDLPLILRYSSWLMPIAQEKVISLLFGRDGNPQLRPCSVVLKHLEEQDSKYPQRIIPFALDYLQHIFQEYKLKDESKEEKELLSSKYVACSLDTIQKLNEAGNEAQFFKSKLRQFLENNHDYDAAKMLSIFPTNNFFFERSILLKNLGQHDQALSILVEILGDFDQALRYCETISKENLLSLMKITVHVSRTRKSREIFEFIGKVLYKICLKMNHNPNSMKDAVNFLPYYLPLNYCHKYVEEMLKKVSHMKMSSSIALRLLENEKKVLNNKMLDIYRSKVTITDDHFVPIDTGASELANQSEFDLLMVLTGKPNEASVYQKSVALHSWLLGYEFTESIMMFCREKLIFFTSSKKASYLEQLKGPFPIEIVTRKTGKESTPEQNYQILLNEYINKYLNEVCSDKPIKVGLILKDVSVAEGVVAQDFKRALDQISQKINQVDASHFFSCMLAVKDEDEIGLIKKASKLSSGVMRDYIFHEILAIIDEERQITHEELSQKIAEDISAQKKIKFPSDIPNELVDLCYPPVIQSTPTSYNLKPSALSNNEKLSSGIVLASIGLRLKAYCSNVGRTLLFEPSKEQGVNYEYLHSLQAIALSFMKENATLSSAFVGVLDHIKKTRNDLLPYFVNNLGFGMGLEFRESDYVINAKNTSKTFKNGMVFNLILGFNNIAPSSGKAYSLLLADTIRIGNDGSAAILTGDAPSKIAEVSWIFNNDDIKKKSKDISASLNLRPRLRSHNQIDENSEAKRKQHQKELYAQRLKESIEALSSKKNNKSNSSSSDLESVKNRLLQFESYRKDTFLPKELAKIVVDKRNDSIILPIYGLPVPFHVLALKNFSKTDDGELRINFNAPGVKIGVKDPLLSEHTTLSFVKSLTFRIGDFRHLIEIFKDLTDMKKNSALKEAEKKEKIGLIEQDSLVEIKSGKRPTRIGDIYLRPALEGKRVPGELEIHVNGVRYRNSLKADQKLDILFNNVQHFIFQPSSGGSFIFLHFNLKNPIMVGKKKTSDVQFYHEVIESSADETGASRHGRRKINFGDEDELAQEAAERKKRNLLNAEFKAFADKIVEASDGIVEVDVPFFELGFTGVPSRSSVSLYPTTKCLISLSEPPPLIVDLSEVEIAHLERVIFGLKNFDLVFVYKDHTKPVTHINAIPMSSLDAVKDWLDSSDVLYIESNVNYNWANVLKTINEDPLGFYEMGGWNFMSPDAEEEGSSADEGEPDDSEYEPEDEEYEESSEDDFDEEGENYDEDDDEEEDEYDEDDDEESDFSEEESEDEDNDSRKKRNQSATKSSAPVKKRK